MAHRILHNLEDSVVATWKTMRRSAGSLGRGRAWRDPSTGLVRRSVVNRRLVRSGPDAADSAKDAAEDATDFFRVGRNRGA